MGEHGPQGCFQWLRNFHYYNWRQAAYTKSPWPDHVWLQPQIDNTLLAIPAEQMGSLLARLPVLSGYARSHGNQYSALLTSEVPDHRLNKGGLSFETRSARHSEELT